MDNSQDQRWRHVTFAHERVQLLRKECENHSMKDDEVILDYFRKISSIVIEFRSLHKKINNGDVCAKLLRSISRKFDFITTSIE